MKKELAIMLVAVLVSAGLLLLVGNAVADTETSIKAAPEEEWNNRANNRVSSNGSSNTIYVPDDYSTIQAAVDAASAGETIIVGEGTYNENVDVGKRLTIISERGSDSTIVIAEDSRDHVFEVRANYVNITGFTVTGATVAIHNPAGIYLVADYCHISNNICKNNYDGILFSASNGNVILNNNCSSNDHSGICLAISNSNNISNNICSSNNMNGIHLAVSNNNVISNNICFSNNNDGVYLASSNKNVILNNNCSSNSHSGICLWDSSGNVISNNTCSLNNGFGGIYLWQLSGNIVSNNTCSNNSRGIYLMSSSENFISNNKCSDNHRGIALYDSINNTISNSICLKNNDGISLEYSNNSVILHNICSKNNDSIFLSGSNNNFISSNDCFSNYWDGIRIYDSKNNTIISNNCSSNSYYGICLRHSNNNVIYFNNFIDNTENVYSTDSLNIWNSTEKITYTYKGRNYTNYLGNHRSDYERSDIDGDGIGDASCSMDSDADYSPLKEPCENYFALLPMPTLTIPQIILTPSPPILTPTTTPALIPGFGAIFTIAGLLTIACLLRRG